ncbi:antitoxin Xre/MbcA/ParS toxin-binding domain-containing protein [Marinobacter sp.]|uniref:antitoxin Xre/MbcA/ParS toxin-binding domain-containing protein n=1 Tax=Marinobacter sp. TaxID=50741 RepID=UPI003A942B5B
MDASRNKPKAGEVLAKAVKRASQELGVGSCQLALILGTDKSKFVTYIDPESIEGFRARRLILIFRYLHILLGGESSSMAHWVKTKNRKFSSSPIECMQTASGLDEIIAYLESLNLSNGE